MDIEPVEIERGDIEPGRNRFSDVIASVEALEAVLGRPNERVAAKVIDTLDVHCRRFIARSPFVLMGSSDAAGNIDVSPKGDPPGFVHVLDDKTLAVPERPGNRRADTFRNLLQNPRVGLIFLIPGKRETLRVAGEAMIVRDADLRERMAVGGRVPDLALVVLVREAFFHCTKCMVRSHLWDPANWPSLDGLPTLAEAAIAHAKLTHTVEEVQGFIDTDLRTRLY
jgi:PPOX class probable FMN-dependent enzyme